VKKCDDKTYDENMSHFYPLDVLFLDFVVMLVNTHENIFYSFFTGEDLVSE
jgi:hypothetical protein